MGKRPGEDGEDATPGPTRKSARVTKGKQAEMQRLEPKPYFVTRALGAKEGNFKHLNGILSYDIPTGKFTWNRQPFRLHSFYEESSLHRHVPFDVEGLLYCHHPKNLDQQAVFSVHTNTWHMVPPAPEISKFESALGMAVDTSQKPYSFTLFQGSRDKQTQVYDSKSGSWSTRSSLLGDLAKESPMYASCMSSDGCLYLSRGSDMILMYSIEKDNWSILRGPPVVADADHNDNDHALEAFEGRIFTARHESRPEDSVEVWELVKEEWVEYARISGAPYEWLQKHVFFGHDTYENLGIVTCFCDEYLFIYNWPFGYARADGYVLFNLATKECTKVDLRKGTIKT